MVTGNAVAHSVCARLRRAGANGHTRLGVDNILLQRGISEAMANWMRQRLRSLGLQMALVCDAERGLWRWGECDRSDWTYIVFRKAGICGLTIRYTTSVLKGR
jgi:hypothetical protein